MRYVGLVFFAVLAWAQQSTQREASYVYDLNGKRVATEWSTERTSSKGESRTVDRAIGLNGRAVPREIVEEKVLRDDAGGRVVERTVIRCDAQGHPGPPERVRIEETPGAGGGTVSTTTTWRADINGAMRLAERAVTEVRKTADGETALTSVARPTLNGALDTVERVQSETRRSSDGASQSTVSTFRRDSNGNMAEAVRQVANTKTQDGQIVSTMEQYQARGAQMQYEGQTVTRTVQGADGSQRNVIDVYRVDVAGRTSTSGQASLVERQTIERRPVGAGDVQETVTVERALPRDATRLGAPQRVSERVCTGSCR